MKLDELRKLAEAAIAEGRITNVWGEFYATANPETILALLDLIAQCKEALTCALSDSDPYINKTKDALAAIEQWEKK
jgi:hypothetical protein